MGYSQAFPFIERLDRVSEPAAVMAEFLRCVGQFGFEYSYFAAIPRPGQKFDEIMFAVHQPAELQEIVIKNQYLHVSPGIRHCRRTARPFLWNTVPYDPVQEPRTAELVKVVTDFGLSKGVMIPIHGPADCEGGVWVSGYDPCVTACDIPIIHLMALYAYDRARILVNERPTAAPSMTAREREVLTWVARGKSAWEVGEILGIAKRTVDEHIQTAMRKLGAVNRCQAVAVALRERIIEP